MSQALAVRNGGELNPVDTTGLCLLSLDGGGVRGLSTLFILKHIMDRLNRQRQAANLPTAKPCEVFDLIGGTGTGGLIAIMLGRLDMDVDDCISAYVGLMEIMFKKKSSSPWVIGTGRIKTRFDSSSLKNAIAEVLTRHGACETDRLNDGKARGCRVFVCCMAVETAQVTRLRSYSVTGEPNNLATLYEAALATSAATGFFDPVSIGAQRFADGALLVNNPVDEVEGEASNIWCSEIGDLKPLVKCLISIGTGNLGRIAIEGSTVNFFSRTLIAIATETEETERRFSSRWAKQFDQKRYFRFNVEQGLQEVGLAEHQELGRIEAATDEYLSHQFQRFRVRDCVLNLKEKQSRTEATFAAIMRDYNASIIATKKPLGLEAQVGLRGAVRVGDYDRVSKLIDEQNLSFYDYTMLLEEVDVPDVRRAVVQSLKKRENSLGYRCFLWSLEFPHGLLVERQRQPVGGINMDIGDVTANQADIGEGGPQLNSNQRNDSEGKWIGIAKQILNEIPAIGTGDGNRLLPRLQGGYNALHFAARMRCSELVQEILKVMKQQFSSTDDFERAVRSPDYNGKTALVYAIEQLDSRSVETLLQHDRGLASLGSGRYNDNPLHSLFQILEPSDGSMPPVEPAEAILRSLVRANDSLLEQECDDSPDNGDRNVVGGTPYQLAMKLGHSKDKAVRAKYQALQETLRRLIYERDRGPASGFLERALYGKKGKHNSLGRLFSLELEFENLDSFARWIENFEPSSHIRLEPWLLSLSLLLRSQESISSRESPVLHGGKGVEEMLETLFKKLSKHFRVEKVWKLQITVDQHYPISDSLIGRYVNQLQVEELCWRKPDLDIDVLLSKPSYTVSLRTLWLFSSTMGSPMYWVSEDGLVRFRNLKRAHIVIVSIDTNRTIDYASRKGKIIARFSDTTKSLGKENIELDVDIVEGYNVPAARPISVTQEETFSQRFFHTFRVAHRQLHQIADNIKDTPIKVALIDTGVDAWQPAIRDSIIGGFSYDDTSPWYRPVDAHGTLMASLIRKINPFIGLYVYRVASFRNDLSVDTAARAIEAAAAAGVDIINCSWTTETNAAKLQHAIEFATSRTESKHPALVFCATSDEPHHYKAIWPADYQSHVISISAASISGRNRVETRKAFDLLILGENIPAAGLSQDGDSDTLVTGSSAATAIATGIASLVLLYCRLLREEGEDWHEFKRRDKMMEIFKTMSHLTDNKERYVDPTLLFEDKFVDGLLREEDKRIFRDSFYRQRRQSSL